MLRVSLSVGLCLFFLSAMMHVNALKFTGSRGVPSQKLSGFGSQNCTTCPGSDVECCGDYQLCCLLEGEYECCKTKGNCCQGTCCGEDVAETCCDGYCCVEETTYCCAKSENFQSRCCPRWSICCDSTASEYGCCMASGYTWTWEDMIAYTHSPTKIASSTFKTHAAHTPRGTPAGDGSSFYALFNVVDQIEAMTIDVDSGKTLEEYKVGFNAFGEMPRPFMFDEKRELFYYLQTNFTQPVPDGQPGRTLTLYTVDPTSGATTNVVVSDAWNFPTGYLYHAELDVIIAATRGENEMMQPYGPYSFYSIAVDGTGATTFIGNCSDNGEDPYAGYFHAASNDGKTLYRLGYQNVTDTLSPGVGLIDISSGTIATTWHSLSAPDNHVFYMVGSIHPVGSGFVSLAQRSWGQENAKPDFDLMYWDLNGNSNEVACLANAHVPPRFGPVLETVSIDQSSYLVAMVEDKTNPELDHWAFSVIDLTNAQSQTINATEVVLEPAIPAGTESVTGLGQPLNWQAAVAHRGN